MPVRRSHIAILLVFGARPALAVPSFQSSSDLGPLVTFLTAIVSISLVLYILFKLFSAASRRNQPRKQRATGAESRENFHYQATAHGFQGTETKLLARIAGNVPANMSSDLLESDTGREYLLSNLEKRINRRQREIQLIRRIQTKLEKMGTNELTPRANVRIETDMRIWVAKKLQGAMVAEEDGEDVFIEVEPISGRLQDISERGAALTADLAVARGDMVEFWSADTDILLSPVTSIVVDVKDTEADRDGLLHLHFMDPPLRELRSAIYALQSRNATDAS